MTHCIARNPALSALSVRNLPGSDLMYWKDIIIGLWVVVGGEVIDSFQTDVNLFLSSVRREL